MTRSWYPALCVIADHELWAYWRMTSGACFWWTPRRADIAPEGFAAQPFEYSEVVSVTVFDRVAGADWTGEWDPIRALFTEMLSVRVEDLADVWQPPATPPNRALRLSLGL